MRNQQGAILRDHDVQTSAYIAGVFGVVTSNSDAVPVLIDGNGNLGTMASSRRYKEDTEDMWDASSGLLQLRPVTFRYKKAYSDGSKPLQYDWWRKKSPRSTLVWWLGRRTDEIETVRYQVLDSMLLNEIQKEHATITAQEAEIRGLEESAPAGRVARPGRFCASSVSI